MNGNKCALVKIDRKAGGAGERVQDPTQPAKLRRIRTQDDEGVICVLDDGAGEVVSERMQQAAITNVLHQKATKKLSDREEEVGAKRIPLTKAVPARDPPPGDAIQQDGYLWKKLSE
jgi:hypothetical protein